MIVLCIANTTQSGMEYDLKIGNKYLVTGISWIPKNESDNQVLYEIVNDAGNLRPVPATLFQIHDSRCSKYWITRFGESGNFSIRPEAFFRDYFHDDLSEGLFEVVNIYKETVSLLRQEFESN
jgi:hypothetical protein